MSINAASKFLSYPVMAVMLLALAIPVYVPLLAKYEGLLLPVVTNVQCGNHTPNNLEDDNDCPVTGEYPILIAETPIYNDVGVIIAVDVLLAFDKIRQCDFIRELSSDGLEVLSHSLTWYDPDDRRLRIDFEPQDVHLPTTRPTGLQTVGPWRVFGLSTLEGSRAVAEHECHPFWNTFTDFYP